MTRGTPRQTILALLALLALPGASAQAVSFPDPAGDVSIDPAPYDGPGSGMVDLLKTTFTVANGTLYVEFQVASLDGADEAAMAGQLLYVARFSVENVTGNITRGVRADRGFLSSGGPLDVPPPWEFKFLSDALNADGTHVDGKVDATQGTLQVEVPLSLLGVGDLRGLYGFSSTAQYHPDPFGANWVDFSEAPGLALNLTTLPPTNTTTSTPPTGGQEASGLPLLACLAALTLTASWRRRALALARV